MRSRISRTWNYTYIVCVTILFLGGTGFGQGTAHGADAVVTDVRVGQKGETTRLVLDLTNKISFKVFALAKPYRIVIDLPEVGWRLPSRPLPEGIGMLKKMRYGLFQPGTSRIVLDVNKPPNIEKNFILRSEDKSKYRLVVDFGYVSKEAFTNSPKKVISSAEVLSKQTTAQAAHVLINSSASAESEPASASPAKRIIFIDPGHGGVDPGAIGISGTYEKHIALAMARELQAEINKIEKFKALLTRKRDVFVPLRERFARARNGGAELFISIHADASKNPKTGGFSVYTLSERASDRETAALAERENKADLIGGINFNEETTEISNILIDLTRRESMNQSAKFAILLVNKMSQHTKLLRNTHRFAGFAVLKAPDVPSVLVELGFLSNPIDEKALKNKKYRAKLAKGMVRAVSSYFSNTEEAYKK
jgi:N-acetylmuramoyl-L-alanine amidase